MGALTGREATLRRRRSIKVPVGNGGQGVGLTVKPHLLLRPLYQAAVSYHAATLEPPNNTPTDNLDCLGLTSEIIQTSGMWH